MFKRNPPLTEQIRLYLKELILDNAFYDGRLPSEMELADALGVSRTTVRDALSRLENEGVIIRKQGAGTFVNPPGLQVKTRLDEMWSYEEMLRAHGYTPAVKVLRMTTASANEADSKALALNTHADVLIIEKLFLEDNTPVIFTRNVIPQALLQCEVEEAAALKPIYEFLDDCCHRHLTYYLSEIVPVVIDSYLAERLDLPPGVAALAFDETGYDTANHPVVWAQSWFRDDLLRFRLIRRRV